MNNTDNTRLFARASSTYRHFRPCYPAHLYDKILSELAPPFTTALDIGAGTGISTNALAAVFQYVTAAEPDPEMLAKAQFPSNVTPICKTGEQLHFSPASFQLITCGNAFYWMDGETLSPALHGWLEQDGLFAAYRYEMPATSSDAANAVLQQENTCNWDDYRHPRLRDNGYTVRCLHKANCFSHIEVMNLENHITMTPEHLAGFFASTSYCSAYMATLTEPDLYISSLARRLGGEREQLTVDFSLELVLARK